MGIIKIECPSCNQQYSVDVSFIAKDVECSFCGNKFKLGGKNVISWNAEQTETYSKQAQQAPTKRSTPIYYVNNAPHVEHAGNMSPPQGQMHSDLMTSTIFCPYCKQSYDVEPNVIGKKVQCAICNESFIAHRNNSKQQNTFIPKIEQQSSRPQQFCFTKAPQNNQQPPPYYVNNVSGFDHAGNIPPPQGQTQFAYEMPQNPGYPQQQVVYVQATFRAKNRGVYVMLGVFFGVFGVHNFYAGHIARGVAHLGLGLWFFIGFLVKISRAEDLIDVSYAFWIFFIAFIVNCIWAITEVITIKDDGKGIPME